VSAPLPRNHFIGIGLVLGLVAILGYFAFVVPVLGPRWPDLRDTPLLNLGLLATALLVSGVAVWRAAGSRPTHRGRVLAPLLGGVNLALAIFFVWYLGDFSARLPEAVAAPAVGDRAPSFALTDQRGQPLTLAALRGKPLVLIFYRGFW
jgi:hypothetical protein